VERFLGAGRTDCCVATLSWRQGDAMVDFDLEACYPTTADVKQKDRRDRGVY